MGGVSRVGVSMATWRRSPGSGMDGAPQRCPQDHVQGPHKVPWAMWWGPGDHTGVVKVT